MDNRQTNNGGYRYTINGIELALPYCANYSMQPNDTHDTDIVINSTFEQQLITSNIITFKMPHIYHNFKTLNVRGLSLFGST